MRRSCDRQTHCSGDHKRLKNRRSVHLSWPIAVHCQVTGFLVLCLECRPISPTCLLLLETDCWLTRRSDQLPRGRALALLRSPVAIACRVTGRGEDLRIFVGGLRFISLSVCLSLQCTNLAARTIELLQHKGLERAYLDPSCFFPAATNSSATGWIVSVAGMSLIRVLT